MIVVVSVHLHFIRTSSGFLVFALHEGDSADLGKIVLATFVVLFGVDQPADVRRIDPLEIGSVAFPVSEDDDPVVVGRVLFREEIEHHLEIRATATGGLVFLEGLGDLHGLLVVLQLGVEIVDIQLLNPVGEDVVDRPEAVREGLGGDRPGGVDEPGQLCGIFMFATGEPEPEAAVGSHPVEGRVGGEHPLTELLEDALVVHLGLEGGEQRFLIGTTDRAPLTRDLSLTDGVLDFVLDDGVLVPVLGDFGRILGIVVAVHPPAFAFTTGAVGAVSIGIVRITLGLALAAGLSVSFPIALFGITFVFALATTLALSFAVTLAAFVFTRNRDATDDHHGFDVFVEQVVVVFHVPLEHGIEFRQLDAFDNLLQFLAGETGAALEFFVREIGDHLVQLHELLLVLGIALALDVFVEVLHLDLTEVPTVFSKSEVGRVEHGHRILLLPFIGVAEKDAVQFIEEDVLESPVGQLADEVGVVVNLLLPDPDGLDLLVQDEPVSQGNHLIKRFLEVEIPEDVSDAFFCSHVGLQVGF